MHQDIKGTAVKLCPYLKSLSCRACHYAVSKLCQGMCHHYGFYGVWLTLSRLLVSGGQMAGKYVILPGSNAGSMFVWRKDRSVYA